MGKWEQQGLSGGEWGPEQPDVEEGDLFDLPSSVVMQCQWYPVDPCVLPLKILLCAQEINPQLLD